MHLLLCPNLATTLTESLGLLSLVSYSGCYPDLRRARDMPKRPALLLKYLIPGGKVTRPVKDECMPDQAHSLRTCASYMETQGQVVYAIKVE